MSIPPPPPPPPLPLPPPPPPPPSGAEAQAPNRSRGAAAVWATFGYLMVGLITIGSVFVGGWIDQSDGSGGEWDGLAGAIYGLLAGLLIGHVAWMVFAIKLLSPFGRGGRAVAAALLTPVAVLVLGLTSGRLGGAAGALVGFCTFAVPASLAAWATQPFASADRGAGGGA